MTKYRKKQKRKVIGSQKPILIISRVYLDQETATGVELSVHKQNLTPITSYTFLESWSNEYPRPQRSEIATILVPGAPPTWTPPAIATVLDADAGLELVDSDRFHDPMYPLEPMFLAALTLEPEFALDGIDFVVDAEVLVQFFGFVAGHEKREKGFGVYVQCIGSTIFFEGFGQNGGSRYHYHDPKSKDSEPYTYTRSFCEESTTWPRVQGGKGGGVSHHRVIRYNLGGFTLLIRYETKTRIPEDSKIKREHSAYMDLDPPGLPRESKNRIAVVASGDPMVLHRNICAVASTVDLGLGSGDTADDPAEAWSGFAEMLEELLPQLWFTGTENLAVGVYEEEVFTVGLLPEGDDEEVQTRTKAVVTKLEEKDLVQSKELIKWELKNQEGLKRLVTLLREVGKAAKVEGCVEVFHDGGNTLKIVKRVARREVFPLELRKKLLGGTVKGCA